MNQVSTVEITFTPEDNDPDSDPDNGSDSDSNYSSDNDGDDYNMSKQEYYKDVAALIETAAPNNLKSNNGPTHI